MAVDPLSLRDRVTTLLTKYPAMRANDPLLMARVWGDDMIAEGIVPSELSCSNFLHLFAASKFCNPESIRRVRQLIQMECPELRGSNYKLRQRNAKVIADAVTGKYDDKNQIKLL